jgi:hypothetical protein
LFEQSRRKKKIDDPTKHKCGKPSQMVVLFMKQIYKRCSWLNGMQTLPGAPCFQFFQKCSFMSRSDIITQSSSDQPGPHAANLSLQQKRGLFVSHCIPILCSSGFRQWFTHCVEELDGGGGVLILIYFIYLYISIKQNQIASKETVLLDCCSNVK